MDELARLTIRGTPQAGTHPHKAALQAPHEPVRSLYVHIPFCFHKCHYCDFYSIVDTKDRQSDFVNALLRELETLATHTRGGPLETVFFGGGTPTLLEPYLWRRLLNGMRGLFDFSRIDEHDPRTGGGECTVECNPETATEELMGELATGGVNRLSVGAQSFDTETLKALERWHDPENVGRAVELARAAGIDRLSVDLIFGVTGQTLDAWATDLDRAVQLGVGHVSCYALTYEPNTVLTKRLELGRLRPIDEDVEIAMQRHTVQRLADQGFERYEVSNFSMPDTKNRADPGGASSHNQAYWRSRSWLGAGPSASSHLRVQSRENCQTAHTVQPGARWKNTPRLGTWLDGVGAESLGPSIDYEPPDLRRALQERLMLAVRTAEGFTASETQPAAEALGVWKNLRRALDAQERTGHLQRTGNSETLWRPTEEGFLFADAIAAALMDAV